MDKANNTTSLPKQLKDIIRGAYFLKKFFQVVDLICFRELWGCNIGMCKNAITFQY